MNEKQTEEKKEIAPAISPVDPFTGAVRPAVSGAVDLFQRYLKQYGWELDHEACEKRVTGENIEDLDLYALTQSYKDQCGMELMKQLIASGQASPEDFYDNGQLGGDNSLPTDINTLHAYVEAEKSNAEKAVGALGGNLGDALASGDIEAYIKGLVDKAIAAQAQAQAPQEENK